MKYKSVILSLVIVLTISIASAQVCLSGNCSLNTSLSAGTAHNGSYDCVLGNCYLESILNVSAALIPRFNNENITPTSPGTYSPGQNYSFNISIINSLLSERLTLNGTNFSLTEYATDQFNATIRDLPAGVYPYFFSATGTIYNRTVSKNYIVEKAQCSVELLVNDATTPITVSPGTPISLFGNFTGGVKQANISLYDDATILNTTNESTITYDLNLTQLNSHSITVRIDESPNVTSCINEIIITVLGNETTCSNGIIESSDNGNPFVMLCNSLTFGSTPLNFERNSNVSILISAFTSDRNKMSGVGSEAWLTVFDPDGIVIVNDEKMQFNSAGFFNYTMMDSLTSKAGTYRATVRADNGFDFGLTTFSFFVGTDLQNNGGGSGMVLGAVFFFFIISLLLFLAFLFTTQSIPMKYTYFILSATFFIISLNILTVILQDIIFNEGLQGFFDTFLAVAFIFYWFAFGLLIIMWILTFFNTIVLKQNEERMRRFGG